MTEDILQVTREGEFTYPIIFRNTFSELSEQLCRMGLGQRKYCVVTDTNVSPLYLEQIKEELEKCGGFVTSYILPAGEENKTLEQVQGIYEHLILHHFDRKDILIALGGGVVGDMTGFAGATYLRGIDFVQIPTTLLAQVDSSIGGKTGVDFLRYKNMVGAFHQPRMVYMNASTLHTLPKEQFSCGMGEVIKHGLIRDNRYTSWLTQNHARILSMDTEILSEMIFRSCVIKKTVVENDPTEQGERAVLNMGHTVGHAVEKLKDFTLLHGQCVAIGCVASAFLSLRRGLISETDFENIKKQLLSFSLPVEVSGLSAQDILSATKSDKKMEQGKIKFVLLERPGHAVVDKTVTDEELLPAIQVIIKETAGNRP